MLLWFPVRRRMAHLAVALAAALPAAGCAAADLTDAPSWDVALNLPVKGTSLSVGALLPAGVTIRQDSAAFTVTVPGTSVARTLGTVCAECVALNGVTAPRPALAFTTAASAALPADVATATLAAGTLSVTILNGFGFDPLGGSAAAALVITVTDAANRVLARDSVNGAAAAIPAAGVLNRMLTLAPGAVRGPLTVATTLAAPAGAPALINTAQAFTVLGSVQNLSVSDVSVTVAGRTVSSGASAFDLSGLDAGIRDRLQGGALRLSITNPFGVTGNLSLTLTGGGVNIAKPLPLAAGASSPTLSFSQQELRAMAGQNLTLTLAGPVSAAAAVRVTPRDRAAVGARLELTLSTEAR